MQIGVSTYSFNRLIRAGQMTQLDSVSAAAELGFDLVEFAEVVPHDGTSRREYAARLAQACAEAGVGVAGYAVAADFLTGSGGNLDAEIERVAEDVDIAAILGAPLLRHDVAWGIDAEPFRSFSIVLPRLAEGCRSLATLGQEQGIRTTVENHGYFCQDSKRVEELVAAVDHRNFGVLIDVGNFLCVDEDPAYATGVLARYATHLHLKDFHVKPGSDFSPGEGWFASRSGAYLRGAILGHGDVPLAACLRVLHDAGYAGAAVIEFEGLEDPVPALRIGLANARRMLATLSSKR